MLKALSLLLPYRPLARGADLLDRQYAGDEWAYLRSLPELPRFGVVAAYCRVLADGGSILELGCGEGLLVERLDRSRYQRYVGVDVSAVAVERAGALRDERTSFVRAEAEAFEPDGTFDLVVFNEVLEYFQDPAAVVRRYERSLSPGGRFVVSMFAGRDTTRTRHIWKGLEQRYVVAAQASVSSGRGFTWRIKVLDAPSANGAPDRS